MCVCIYHRIVLCYVRSFKIYQHLNNQDTNTFKLTQIYVLSNDQKIENTIANTIPKRTNQGKRCPTWNHRHNNETKAVGLWH